MHVCMYLYITSSRNNMVLLVVYCEADSCNTTGSSLYIFLPFIYLFILKMKKTVSYLKRNFSPCYWLLSSTLLYEHMNMHI